MIAGLDALPPLLTVTEAAEVRRVGRSWVYELAAEIGAVKLGPGQTAPLRVPREGVWRIVGTPPPRRDRRSVPARRAWRAETSNGGLRARPACSDLNACLASPPGRSTSTPLAPGS
jgi:hypothetical protein